MSVAVHLQPGPLAPVAAPFFAAGAGAIVVFEGRVRPLEDGHPIVGLDYEAYEPMAGQMLGQIAAEMITRHGLLGIDVAHSTSQVNVGQCAFRLRIAAPHRREAMLAMSQFIDRLKQDVPIWKTPIAQP
jgi:molybdopterin synthase catalytic subunit